MKKAMVYCIVLSVMVLSSCSSPKKVKTDKESSTPESTVQKTLNNNTDKMTQVLLKTTYGDITIALYDETPEHKANFLKLVNDHFYDGLLFHRIIQGFMIQGGDPDSKNAKPGQMLGSGDLGYTIPAEFVSGRFHKRGAVAAAREGDQVNPQKASSGSQFYIVDGTVYDNEKMNMISQRTGIIFSPEQVEAYTTIGGAPWLDDNYTVFGEVVSGMDVVDKIAAQKKDRNDRPLEDIKIVSAKIVKK